MSLWFEGGSLSVGVALLGSSQMLIDLEIVGLLVAGIGLLIEFCECYSWREGW